MTTKTDFTKYPAKEPSSLHLHFANWIKEKTNFDPSRDARSKEDAFLRGVQLGTLLRQVHQRSPENRERRAAEALEQRESEQEKVEVVEEPKPKRGRKKAAAAAAAPASGTRRKRAPRPSEGSTAEAPF